MNGIVQDMRYALRGLWKCPGFTTVAVLTLTICVGANAAVFATIRAVLFKTPPYADPERLVLLGETRPDTPGYSGAISAPNYLDWVQQNTVFEQMAAVTGGGGTLTGGTREPVYVRGRTVSASYFDVFGMGAALGRTFAPNEDHATKNHVVVLSHRLWASQFGSDPAVIGKPVRLDREVYTVIGVMPPGSGVDLLDPELWTPRDLGREGGASTVGGATSRTRRDLNRAVARLKRGVTIERARSQMDEIARRLSKAYPESNRGWGVSVQPWPRPVSAGFEQSLYLLCAATGIVFLIGCVNLANLALVRGIARSRELAIRLALGARRAELVRQLLMESVVIAIVGGLGGLLVGYATVWAMAVSLPSAGVSRVMPAETVISIDAGVWLFALAISALSPFACGLGPALRSTASLVASSIRERGTDNRAQPRLRRTLIVAEVALAFALVTTAGLLIKSVYSLQHQIAAGVDSTNVLTAGIPISARQFDNPQTLNAYLNRIRDRIQSIPGVRDVAFAEGVSPEGTPFLRSFQIADQPPIERARRPICGFNSVSPSYFRAIELHVLRGRGFADHDRTGNQLVVIINETFARTYFPNMDPIGRRLLMNTRPTGSSHVASDESWEVVGVVEDEGLSPWTRAPQALIYGTREQNPSDQVMLIVRANVNAISLQESVRKAVVKIEPDQALAEIRTLDQHKADYVAPDRLRSLLLSVFAGIAIALAAIGLYGVLSYTVVQRQHEIGIRSALGASVMSTATLVIREGMSMTAWGVALGLASSFLAGRVLTTVLFGVEPFDPSTVMAVTALFGLIALAACFFPARRAARVDPLVALRNE
jgi:putative ABC transport system permease protein